MRRVAGDDHLPQGRAVQSERPIRAAGENGGMVGPHKVPVLVNRKEHEADSLLREVGVENRDRLLTKVRLADVVQPGDWMTTRAELGTFALKSHLDFVMVEEDTSIPLFAVEIDGSQHSRAVTQRRRDLMKDELCRAAHLPLLRVTSEFSRREGKHILLKYVCDAFYKSLMFEEAQKARAIPWDEPFDHASFIERDEETGEVLFGSIDARARLDLLKISQAGAIPHHAPDSWLGDKDDWGNIRAEVYLPVGNHMTLVGTSQVRHFGFFGMPASELAEELAVLELRREVERWLNGEAVALAPETFRARFRAFVLSDKPLNHVSSSGLAPENSIPYPEFQISYGPFKVTFGD